MLAIPTTAGIAPHSMLPETKTHFVRRVVAEELKLDHMHVGLHVTLYNLGAGPDEIDEIIIRLESQYSVDLMGYDETNLTIFKLLQMIGD